MFYHYFAQRIIASIRDKPRDVDLLVTTPGSLSIALRQQSISPALVNHIVIDEADSLMDDSFNATTSGLIRVLSVSISSFIRKM